MNDYLKCECPHCGQSVEYLAEGTGQTVPCPTCEQPFALIPAGEAQSNSETQGKAGWDDWTALNERLAERRTESGIPLSDESTAERTPPEASQGVDESQRRNEWAESPGTKKHSIQSGAQPLTGNADEHLKASGPETIPPATNPIPVQASRQRGRARPQFAQLTAETIRTKINSAGDIPLHHAARLGRISEIPKHLLTIELFMVRNNHRQKHTPIHAAAQHGRLDKVPSEFLNKVTVTASVKYENPVVRAKTETPLHVAVRCGHADQIPQEFLKPKFLSIAATCNEETVLHELAYARRLDLVPQI